jgi:hypothetical protein
MGELTGIASKFVCNRVVSPVGGEGVELDGAGVLFTTGAVVLVCDVTAGLLDFESATDPEFELFVAFCVEPPLALLLAEPLADCWVLAENDCCLVFVCRDVT